MAEQEDEATKNLRANPDLEAQVVKMGQANIHPLVEKIQHKFGVFNVIRNARNQRQIDVADVEKQES